MEIIKTTIAIRSKPKSARQLPTRTRLDEQLDLLLNDANFTVDKIFEAANGTIVGLPRGRRDRRGRCANYFRIDLQTCSREYLNIQYQVSKHTVACVLVARCVRPFTKVLETIREAMRLSFESGTYPTSGLPNGGSPNIIYKIEVHKAQNLDIKNNTSRKGKKTKNKSSKHQIIHQRKATKSELVNDGVVLNDKISYYNAEIEQTMQSIHKNIILKQAVASFLKKIPMIGLIVGLLLALYQYRRGEYKRALCEILSGAFSLAQPFGIVVSIAVSIAIDGGIVAMDLMESEDIKSIENYTATIKCAEQQLADIRARYRALGMTDSDIEEYCQKRVKKDSTMLMIEEQTKTTKTTTYRRRFLSVS